jgi:ribosomal protein L7/L12
MGEFYIWTIVAVVAIAFVVGFIIRRVFFGKKQLPDPLTNMNMTLVEDGGVEELLRSGRKIEAIKRYRQQTGVGLKEAKEAVERMEAGNVSSKPVVGMNDGYSVGSDELRNSYSGDSYYSSLSFNDELRELVRKGKKISAIKRYREVTGVGLKEAKDAVDRLEAELRN